jgi:Glycosyl hydrolases family 16
MSNYTLDLKKANWLTLCHAAGMKACVIVLAGGIYSPTWFPNQYDITGFSNAAAALAKNYLIPGDVPSPTMAVTEYAGSAQPTPTPTPAPTPTPTPTPVAGVQPTITLPSNYALAWNQDFTSPVYKPFNVPAIVTLKGPCLPAPGGSIWCASRYNFQGLAYTGTDGMPFTTDNGYLNIHMFSDSTGSWGGILSSVDTLTGQQRGFMTTNAYWEAKIKLPAVGVPLHPAFWVTSNGSGLPVMGEIDIMEFGVQVPGSTGSYQIHLHNWSNTDKGSSAGDFNVNNLSVTPDGYHIFGCLVEPLKVSVYLDGKLVQAFSVGSNFNTPMEVILGISSDNRASSALSDMACQYVRCWTPQ